MKRIGGNVTADFQGLKIRRNSIGEMTSEYESLGEHKGFLDYASGSSAYKNYNVKTEETSHVFICDAFDINLRDVSRLIIDGRTFDVLYSDNPMELGYHFEIFLKELVQDGR